MHALAVIAKWRKQQEEAVNGGVETLSTQIDLRGVALGMVMKMKEQHPARSKSWIIDRLLIELNEFREGKR